MRPAEKTRRRGVLMAAFSIGCLLASALLAFAAQQEESPKESRPGQDKQSTSLGEPVDPKTYIIGAEENLTIEVWKEPNLSRTVLVRRDGKISLPLLGEVQAGGLTPEDLTVSLTAALSKYMTSPNVIVSVSAVNSKKYFIIGQVEKPGSYPLVLPTTVLQALAIAGGFKDYADLKNIKILRGTKRLRFNYKDFVNGKDEAQNILLESGDQLIIP